MDKPWKLSFQHILYWSSTMMEILLCACFESELYLHKYIHKFQEKNLNFGYSSAKSLDFLLLYFETWIFLHTTGMLLQIPFQSYAKKGYDSGLMSSNFTGNSLQVWQGCTKRWDKQSTNVTNSAMTHWCSDVLI